MTTTGKPDEFWVVLCWKRVLAGPEVEGPPWLFIRPDHAERYAAQLRTSGVECEVRGFVPSVLKWRDSTLIQVPDIPPPSFESSDGTAPTTNPAPESSSPAQANGTTLAPPPNVE